MTTTGAQPTGAVMPYTKEDRELIARYGMCWCGAPRDADRIEHDGDVKWVLHCTVDVAHNQNELDTTVEPPA